MVLVPAVKGRKTVQPKACTGQLAQSLSQSWILVVGHWPEWSLSTSYGCAEVKASRYSFMVNPKCMGMCYTLRWMAVMMSTNRLFGAAQGSAARVKLYELLRPSTSVKQALWRVHKGTKRGPPSLRKLQEAPSPKPYHMQLAPPLNPSTLPLKVEYYSSTFCASRLHRMPSNSFDLLPHEDPDIGQGA